MRKHVSNRVKDCHNCPYVDKAMQDALEIPPSVETYTLEYGGKVLVSPYHGENELEENLRIAKRLADELKEKVYLLPRLDPSNPEQARLRLLLHPLGVPAGKNPDYLIGGRIYDAKVMEMGTPIDAHTQKKRLENRIKKAKEQADNIIIEVPTHYDRQVIDYTIHNYLSRSSKERAIIILHGDDVYRYRK